MIYLYIVIISSLLYSISQARAMSFNEKVILNTFFFIPTFIILTLFLGLRFNVGRDFDIYYNIFYLGYGAEKEIGFNWLNRLFLKLDFSFNSILILMAALSLIFFFLVLKTLKKDRIFSFLVFLLGGPYIYLFNVVRQGLTNFIFLYIIEKFRKKKYFITALLILFGSLFHLSILFAALILPFLVRKYNRINLLFGFFIALLLNLSLNIQSIFIRFLHFIPYFGNIYLQKNLLDQNIIMRNSFGSGTGLGYLFKFLLVFVSIIQYNRISKDLKVLPYLNAFIFWGIFKILTLQVWIIDRQLDYLLFSIIVVVPKLIRSFENKKIRFIVWIIVLIVLTILFIKSTVYSLPDEKIIPYHWLFSSIKN